MPLLAKPLRTAGIAAVVWVQAAAAIFFVADAIGDLAEGARGVHLLMESVLAAGLCVGTVLNALELRFLLSRDRRQQEALSAARGEMAELIRLRCESWRLTAAEADVALLALKGLAVDEIAALRHSAPGTVRAQLTRVYAKAGVDSRSGLLALFLEDLLADPLRELRAAA